MSSGGAAVVPMAVVIAVGGAVVLAAVGAAVLVVYAASEAAEGAVRAVGRWGASLEAQAAAQCAADRKALEWQAVAADVVGLNARLRLAARRAREAGTAVDLPPPFDLTGAALPDAIHWAEQAQLRLADAQDAIDAATTDAQWRHLVAGLPASVPADSGTAAALAGYREALRHRRTTLAEPPVEVGASVEDVLRGLDPDADTADQTMLLHAAALVRAQENLRDAEAYLQTLQTHVKNVNARVADRRAAAQWLQALEEPSVAAELADADPPSPFSGTAARLAAVIDGSADLSPELRIEARKAVTWAFDLTRRLFILDRVRAQLAAAGLRIDGEFATAHGMRLAAGRPDWRGEHSVQMWVDGKGSVTGRVVRERAETGDEAVARDKDRCAALHAVLRALPAGAPGMTVTVEPDRAPLHRHRPGQPDTDTAVRQPGYRTHGKA